MDLKKKKVKCEIWKDIPNYEGLYQVSNMGNVKSISHYAKNNAKGGLRLTKGIILSQYKMPNGYYSSLSEAERETGISRKAIKKSCENGNKYGGYRWRLDV